MVTLVSILLGSAFGLLFRERLGVLMLYFTEVFDGLLILQLVDDEWFVLKLSSKSYLCYFLSLIYFSRFSI